MAKTMFEIAEITELGQQVWQIVEDGNPQNKVVVVGVNEWESFEAWKSAQRLVGRKDPERKMDTIPITKERIADYLDGCINFWRKKQAKGDTMAKYYIDAFQSVRLSLIGNALPEQPST